MKDIRSLNEFLEIIIYDNVTYAEVGRKKKAQQPNRRAETWIQQFSNTLVKDPPNELSIEGRAFIEKNADKIYDYAFQRNSSSSEEDNSQIEFTFYFRGVSDKKYPIAPGIYRKNEKHDEAFYFNEIQVRCSDVFSHLHNLEKLTYMQHYGCPTRLLDITSNPLVALFFACSNDFECDGSVYIFSVSKEDVLYSGSDRIQMLATLPQFPKKDQQQLQMIAYRDLQKRQFSKKTNGAYSDKTVERFFHAVKHEHPEFEREIDPLDLLQPQFVLPYKNNPRILKQDGAFIISGMDFDENNSDRKIRKYLAEELIIPADHKRRILKELEIVGIHQGSLFPEVEMVAKYLKYR